MAEDLSLDLEELRQLHTIAKRPRTLSLISSEIRNLEKLAKETVSAPPPPAPSPILSVVKVQSGKAINYITLGSFSWDQDNEKVKVSVARLLRFTLNDFGDLDNDKVRIYISLTGVEEEKVESEFKAMSFDIKFHDVQGKNYRCAIPKLNKEIVPEKCKLLIKPTRVVVTLFKSSKGNWLDLHFKEDKFKPNVDKEKDPMAGIMDLMKNMYEDGDDEMKKTIAQAWTDARSGKTADPMKGYR